MLNKIKTYLINSKNVRNENLLLSLLLAPYKLMLFLSVRFRIKYKHITIKYLYRKITKNSTFFSESEIRMCSLFPKKIINKTIEFYNPESVLDLGCGVGKSLDYFKSNNIFKSFWQCCDIGSPTEAGGWRSFNEQLPKYWIKKFNGFGYKYNEEKTNQLKETGELFCENMLVFER